MIRGLNTYWRGDVLPKIAGPRLGQLGLDCHEMAPRLFDHYDSDELVAGRLDTIRSNLARDHGVPHRQARWGYGRPGSPNGPEPVSR
jgi:hypothetical protein